MTLHNAGKIKRDVLFCAQGVYSQHEFTNTTDFSNQVFVEGAEGLSLHCCLALHNAGKKQEAFCFCAQVLFHSICSTHGLLEYRRPLLFALLIDILRACTFQHLFDVRCVFFVPMEVLLLLVLYGVVCLVAPLVAFPMFLFCFPFPILLGQYFSWFLLNFSVVHGYRRSSLQTTCSEFA